MPDRTRNPGTPVTSLFRDELRRARTAAGLTQEELAARISFSPALVAAIETGRRLPSADFSKQCDQLFNADGRFARMQVRTAEETAPSWFREWAGLEKEAVMLKSWEPLVVPGLLQSPDYAREILRVAPGISEDETELRLAERLGRQAILERDSPPMLFAIIDEGVLRRDIGGPKVMRDQLARLLEASELTRVSVQVVPRAAGSHPGLTGPFVIAAFSTAPEVAYIDTALTGQLVERHQDVGEMMLLFDIVRGAALPCRASADLIREVMNSWN